MAETSKTVNKEMENLDIRSDSEGDELNLSKKFDYEIKDFFNFLRLIHKKEASKKINLASKPSPFIKYLDNYEKFYDKSEPEDHIPFFSDLFDKYRKHILNSYENDDWICDNNICIEIPNAKIKKAIQLTIFYKKAYTLQKEAQDSIDKLPLEAQEKAAEQANELDYPSIFMCHLYRLFSYSCELNTDREKLNLMIVEMEKDLDIGSTVNPPQIEFPSMGGIDAANLGGMIGGIINGLKDTIPMKEGDQIPSSDEIQGFISNIFNNPKLQKTVGGMMKGLTSQNPKDGQEVIQNFVKNISDPEVTGSLNDIIRSSVENSAEQKIKAEQEKSINENTDHNIPSNDVDQ